MNMYSKQAKFLSKYEINTIKDLEDFQREKEEKINIDLEAREKLALLRPKTLGEASQITNVHPSDIDVLSFYVRHLKNPGR